MYLNKSISSEYANDWHSDVDSELIYSGCVTSPKLSVLIPTYKRPQYLAQAIRSALNQEGIVDYEIVVCDNNPDYDESMDSLMNEFRGTRVSYYKNRKNIGMAGNWNRLYSLAKGEWTIMLHDDDLFQPYCLNVLFNLNKELLTKYDLIFVPCTEKMEPESSNQKLWAYPAKLTDALRGNVFGTPLGMCIKRETVYKLGGFMASIFIIDYEFYVRALLNNFKIGIMKGMPMVISRIEVSETLRAESLIAFAEKGEIVRNRIMRTLSRFQRLIYKPYFHHASVKAITRWIKFPITDREKVMASLDEFKRKRGPFDSLLCKMYTVFYFIDIKYFRAKKLKVNNDSKN